MPATLIPTSANSQLYKDAEKKFFADWASPYPKPAVVNVFYVNHEGQQVWYNYEAYSKRKGNEKYMYHGPTRACTIGDDNSQTTACQLPNCGLCHILRATLDPSRSDPKAMYGIGAYLAPNSSKSANPRLYLKNADTATSPNLVLLRCSVALGKEFPAYKAMKGVKGPPIGHDSITGVTKANGGAVKYSESVVFTKDAMLPVQVIVLRFPPSKRAPNTYVSPYGGFTTKLTNVTDADWSRYPEAIRDTRKGDVLWTDGNASYTFASAPNIRAYKVVRRSPEDSPTGTVVAEGYAASNSFYFRLG